MILNTKKLKGLTIGEYFLLYAMAYGIDLEDSRKRLERKGIDNLEDAMKLMGQSVKWDEAGRWMKLAKEMRERFPKGMKSGEYLWRCSTIVAGDRLRQLFEETGEEYSDEEILNATDAYIAKFKEDTLHMRTLKYFIFKNTAEGFTSDLLDMLEELKEDQINTRSIYESKNS